MCRHAQLDMSQTQAANCLEMQQTDIQSKHTSQMRICYSHILSGTKLETYFLSVSGVDTSLLKPKDSWRERQGRGWRHVSDFW